MPKFLLEKEHHRQEFRFSCVPAAAKIILNYLGVVVESEAYLRKILKTKSIGTNVPNLIYLKDEKDFNVDVRMEHSSISGLKEYLKEKKIPIIVVVDTGYLTYHKMKSVHAIVVVGYDEENIIVNDPWFINKEIEINENDFRLAWGKFGNLSVTIFRKDN